MPRRWDLARVAFTISVVVAGGTLPSALYHAYELRFGVDPATLSSIYGVYAIAVVATLLALGGLSDRVGRRTVILLAVAMATAGSATFALADDFRWLYGGRALHGVAVGLLLATATAYLVELDRRGTGRGTLAATLANNVGGATGPLLGGVMAGYVASPTVVPYVAHAALLALSVLAIGGVPETLGRASSSRPRVVLGSVLRDLDARFIAAAVGCFSLWATAGVVLALTSTLLPRYFGLSEPLVAGGALAVMSLLAALSQLACNAVRQPRGTLIGLLVLNVGLVSLALALFTGATPLFAIGLLLGGVGQGLAFRGVVAIASSSAPVAGRSTALSLVYVAGYAGVSLPAVAVSVLAASLGFALSIALFAGASVALCGVVAVLFTRRAVAAAPATG